jgi:hypothetical protein
MFKLSETIIRFLPLDKTTTIIKIPIQFESGFFVLALTGFKTC